MAITNRLGDIAEGAVIADLLLQGFKVALPLSSDSPIDLLALDPKDNWHPIRIQVKARSAHRGKVEVALKNCSLTKRGLKYRYLNKAAVDIIAIYRSDLGAVAYIPITAVNGLTISLRVSPAKNRQERRIRHFGDFARLRQAVSSETIRPTPE